VYYVKNNFFKQEKNMSHFATLVLINKEDLSEGSAEEAIGCFLSPFDENTEVDGYDEDCYCVGTTACNDARILAEIEYGKTGSELRDEFWDIDEDKRPEWNEFIKDYSDIADRHMKAHALYNKPDADCEDCHGTGTRTSHYNPDSKWDWYQIGGRWTGFYSDYNPATDPKNIEVCDLCEGTGMRDDWAWIDADGVHYKDDWAKQCKGCNSCQGTGKSVKWPTSWENSEHDVLPVSAVLDMMNREKDPKEPVFAVVTPDGEWIESGSMGWWGIISDEKDENTWGEEFKNILEKYSDCIAVVVDCHI